MNRKSDFGKLIEYNTSMYVLYYGNNEVNLNFESIPTRTVLYPLANYCIITVSERVHHIVQYCNFVIKVQSQELRITVQYQLSEWPLEKK